MTESFSDSTSAASCLTEFIAATEADRLPPQVVASARRALLDALGCGLFGAGQPWGRIMADEARSDRSAGEATLLGGEDTVAAPAAALCNGTAIHGYELDDLIPAAIVHPGTVIVPAVLAAAEACDASGADLLRGIALGYEACARVSVALGLEPSHRGFHKTAVVGPVAAALACGAVRRLSASQLASAAGLACSTAAGIKSFVAGGGGMVKRMHAGRAAEAGVRMSALAARGFTGPGTAIDGRYGLLEVFAGESAKPEALAAGLGERWAIEEVWVKVYPVCGWIQGVVQLLAALQREAPIPAPAVRRVVVGTSAFAVNNNANARPVDTMDAQYSIPYCVAAALLGDPADPVAYLPQTLRDPARLALAAKVDLRVDPEAEAVYPARFGSRVQVHLRDGSVREAATLDPKGTAADPCSDAELEAKFTRLAAAGPAAVDPRAVIEGVRRLGAASSVRAFSRCLRAPPRGQLMA
ncbi:MAG: MmgE/PrpD family protein [Betaproteobacteria bacterium]|nr:MAG: MmgE/PrpD family protein [Betaproteobacteria bacterium]